jgi:hypothetical protein
MSAPAPDQVYRGVTRIFSVLILGFGVTIFVVTLVNGGGPLSLGFWLGLGFAGLGAARFYLSRRSAPD